MTSRTCKCHFRKTVPRVLIISVSQSHISAHDVRNYPRKPHQVNPEPHLDIGGRGKGVREPHSGLFGMGSADVGVAMGGGGGRRGRSFPVSPIRGNYFIPSSLREKYQQKERYSSSYSPFPPPSMSLLPHPPLPPLQSLPSSFLSQLLTLSFSFPFLLILLLLYAHLFIFLVPSPSSSLPLLPHDDRKGVKEQGEEG